MKIELAILSGIILLLMIGNVRADQFPQPYDQYVNDYAHIFSADQTAYLESLLYEVQQNTTAQVVIVTIPSLNGSDISQYTTDLGQSWGVGNKDNDNGLVILYSAQENKIFAATGYGLEGILPDSKIGRLLDQSYVPLRDSGNVGEGITNFTTVVAQVIEQNADEVRSGQAAANNSSTGIDPFFIFLIIIIIITIISRIFAAKKRKNGKGSGSGWWLIPLFLPFPRGGGGIGGGGFGGGFGGGGFGGGGFGGGGAGR